MISFGDRQPSSLKLRRARHRPTLSEPDDVSDEIAAIPNF